MKCQRCLTVYPNIVGTDPCPMCGWRYQPKPPPPPQTKEERARLVKELEARGVANPGLIARYIRGPVVDE